jgi:nucleoside 2-deoxyribosyltransferase
MRDVMPEMEILLTRVERLLAQTGKGKATGLRQGRILFRHALYDFSRRSYRLMGPEMESALRMLAKRADAARTSDELRDVLRDFRQYTLAASSFSQARQLEGRLRELEGQIKVAAEDVVVDGLPEDEVITLESLKSKRVLFAIMPFHEDFIDIWSGGVKRAAVGTGLTPIRIDMITTSSAITDDIVAAIKVAEIVVVDVTGNNPNVMFEFGFALAKTKRHVVISQSTEFLTFDIKNVRTIIYKNSWQGIESLYKELQSFIKGAIGTKKAGKKKAKSSKKKTTKAT